MYAYSGRDGGYEEVRGQAASVPSHALASATGGWAAAGGAGGMAGMRGRGGELARAPLPCPASRASMPRSFIAALDQCIETSPPRVRDVGLVSSSDGLGAGARSAGARSAAGGIDASRAGVGVGLSLLPLPPESPRTVGTCSGSIGALAVVGGMEQGGDRGRGGDVGHAGGWEAGDEDARDQAPRDVSLALDALESQMASKRANIEAKLASLKMSPPTSGVRPGPPGASARASAGGDKGVRTDPAGAARTGAGAARG